MVVKGAGIGASVQDASDLLVPPHAHTRSVVETTAKNDNCIEITIKLTVETQGSLKRKLDDDPCLVTSGLEVERENLVDMEKKTSKSTKKRKMGNGEGSAGSEKTVEKAEPEATKDVHYKAGSEPNDKPKINVRFFSFVFFSIAQLFDRKTFQISRLPPRPLKFCAPLRNQPPWVVSSNVSTVLLAPHHLPLALHCPHIPLCLKCRTFTFLAYPLFTQRLVHLPLPNFKMTK